MKKWGEKNPKLEKSETKMIKFSISPIHRKIISRPPGGFSGKYKPLLKYLRFMTSGCKYIGISEKRSCDQCTHLLKDIIRMNVCSMQYFKICFVQQIDNIFI